MALQAAQQSAVDMNRENRIKANNSINVIHPYRTQYKTWVYDDPDLGIFKEAFVMGSSEVIDQLVGKETNQFTAIISSSPIPGPSAVLEKTTPPKFERVYTHNETGDDFETKGWYQLLGTDMKHWLCPRVLDYFQDYPEHIYVRIEK